MITHKDKESAPRHIIGSYFTLVFLVGLELPSEGGTTADAWTEMRACHYSTFG